MPLLYILRLIFDKNKQLCLCFIVVPWLNISVAKRQAQRDVQFNAKYFEIIWFHQVSQAPKVTESLNFYQISLAGNNDLSAINLNNLSWELNRLLLPKKIPSNPATQHIPRPNCQNAMLIKIVNKSKQKIKEYRTLIGSSQTIIHKN